MHEKIKVSHYIISLERSAKTTRWVPSAYLLVKYFSESLPLGSLLHLQQLLIVPSLSTFCEVVTCLNVFLSTLQKRKSPLLKTKVLLAADVNPLYVRYRNNLTYSDARSVANGRYLRWTNACVNVHFKHIFLFGKQEHVPVKGRKWRTSFLRAPCIFWPLSQTIIIWVKLWAYHGEPDHSLR